VARRLSGPWPTVVAGVAGLGLCCAAAATTPFTPGAVATVVDGYLVVLMALPLHRMTGAGAAPVPETAAGAGVTIVTTDAGPRRGWRWAVVVVPPVAAVCWELLCVVHGDRSAWPTLSSLLDDVDAWPIGRGAACAAWLGLGWALVTR